jgi:hypothetical protein
MSPITINRSWPSARRGFVYKLPRAAFCAAEAAAFLDSHCALFDPKVGAGLHLAHGPGEFARIAVAKGR